MAENCKNCNQLITEIFCANCGQKKYKKIDRKYIIDEIQYTFLHANKGLMFSVKNILKNPGKTARAFIDGNRVNHYKPILLTFVLSGISTFISYKLLKMNEIMSKFYSVNNMNSKYMEDVYTFMGSYNSFLMLFLIPFFALATKIPFRKLGHNYYEHIVMNSYILSCYTLFSMILLYPMIFIFKESGNIFMYLILSAFLIVPFILVWFFKEFYKPISMKIILKKVLGIVSLTVLGCFFVILLFTISLIIYVKQVNPEAIKYFKPQ